MMLNLYLLVKLYDLSAFVCMHFLQTHVLVLGAAAVQSEQQRELL